jgi:AraC-like DNA-binding protein
MSRRAFTRYFIAQTGTSFAAWGQSLLLGKALSLLADGLTVAQAADQLGYANPSSFIVAFRKHYRVSPRRFMQQLLR